MGSSVKGGAVGQVLYKCLGPFRPPPAGWGYAIPKFLPIRNFLRGVFVVPHDFSGPKSSVFMSISSTLQSGFPFTSWHQRAILMVSVRPSRKSASTSILPGTAKLCAGGGE
jgi:hypothetical protein